MTKRMVVFLSMLSRGLILLMGLLGGLWVPQPVAAQGPNLTFAPNWGSLPDAVNGQAWSYTFTATGGTAPYTFSMNGTIPGLTLTGGGLLSGTPTSAGSYSIKITVKDGAGDTVSSSTTFVVLGATNTSITSTATAYPDGTTRMVGYALWVSVHVSDSLAGSAPTGSVTVQSGGITCIATLDGTSNGRCALFFTTPGSKTITASYSGDSRFSGSDSSGRIETVTALSLTPTLSAGRNHTCYLDSSGVLSCWGLTGNYPAAVDVQNQRFTSVSAGGYHTCALKTDGSAACWGDDPQIRSGVSAHLIALSAGMNHVCAIDEDEHLRCWGQLSGTPASVTDQAFTMVSAGNLHTCAIRKSDSKLACWGDNVTEPWTIPTMTVQDVALGYGHACAITSSGTLTCWGALAATPPAGNTYRQVASGSSYSCAQKNDGRLVCWGSNAPLVDTTDVYTTLSAGFLHTCTLAAKTGGGSYLACWGQDAYGRAPRITLQPDQFTPYLSVGKPWSQTLTPGGGSPDYTIALSAGALPAGLALNANTISGTPSTVGNYNFSLRASENFAVSTLPLELKPLIQAYTVTIEDAGVSLSITSAPTDIPAGSPVLVKTAVTHSGHPALKGNVKISGGDSAAACQVKVAADGSAECSIYFSTEGTKTITAWYDGDEYYQASSQVTREINIKPVTIDPVLAAGNAFNCSLDAKGSPTCWGKNDAGQADAPALMIYNRISAGDATTCARGLDSQLYCWGWNGYRLAEPPAGPGFEMISVGSSHACALNWYGSVQCWGNSADGRTTPPALLYAVAISAGDEHTCALDGAGQPVCWGKNINGQANSPDIGVVGAFNAISAGGTFTCGLHTDGRLECWGGSGTVDAIRTVPDGTYQAVEAGYSHACAIGLDGKVICWGNTSGGKTAAPDQSFQAVSAGRDHTCGIRSDGTLACWGGNTYGQAPVITIQPVSLPMIDVAAAWQKTIVPAGGRVSAYSFSLESGALPDGLSLDSNSGAIGGTPLRAGYYNFTLRVVERNLTLPVVAEQAYSLTVRAKTAVSLRADPAAPMLGKPVRLSVSVAENPGGGLNAIPTGKVTVQSSGGPGCEITLDQGQGSCVVFYTTEGSTTLTASYGGDTLFLVGDNAGEPLTLTVAPFAQALRVVSGSDRTYIHKADGRLACMGANCSQFNLSTVYTAIGAGDQFACVLAANGQVTCMASAGTTEQHPGPYTGLSVGSTHACAIRIDGALDCWGNNSQGQAAPLAGTFTAISAGAAHTCGIQSDGTLACWGASQGTLPMGAFNAISAGANHTCALRDDGTLACFGANDAGQATPPAGVYESVSSGSAFSCALNGQGKVTCWGQNDVEQATSSAGSFIALGAYADHACAVRPGFKLTCWGKDDSGEAPQLHVTPISEAEIVASHYWEHNFNPRGGTKAYHATISSGTLPTGVGLDLTLAGLYLYGTPIQPGSYAFGITWEDSYSYSLAVNSVERIPLVLEQVYNLAVTGADLSVKIAPQASTKVVTGKPLQFDYTVSNTTALTDPDVLLTVVLPEGLGNVSFSGLPGCQQNGLTLVCAMGALDVQSEQKLTVSGVVTASAGSTLITSAQISSRLANWPEINGQDNKASASVLVEKGLQSFSDNFDETLRNLEWSAGLPAASPAGVTYLGGFGSSDALRLTLKDLEAHKRVQVSFDLYVIGPWTGSSGEPGTWAFGLTGATPLLTTTFSNAPASSQAYPGNYPGSDNPARTSATGTNVLGFPGQTDTRYHLTFSFDHNASDLDLTLQSLNLPDGATWGIDAVQVKVDQGWTKIFVPIILK